MRRNWIGVLVVASLVFSIALLAYPYVKYLLNKKVVDEAVDGFKKISLAIRNFFYNEESEAIIPNSVNLKILEDRYYLTGIDKKKFEIVWIDVDAKDDGILKAVVVFLEKVNPIVMYKEFKSVKWYNPKSGKIEDSYSDQCYPAKVVEVKVD